MKAVTRSLGLIKVGSKGRSKFGSRKLRTGSSERTVRGNVWRRSAILMVALALLVFAAGAQSADTVTYHYTDAQGTVLAKADAAGNIINNPDYRPFGVQVQGTAEDGPGYTGHVNDVDSALVYMQARYYDPDMGRFISTDLQTVAAENVFNCNRYTYTSDDPIGRIDLDGKRDIYIGGAGDKRMSQIVLGYAANERTAHPDRDVQYFSYRDHADIAKAIAAPLQSGEPLNIIGHSLGGRQAVKQAAAAKVDITNLITIDPVGSAGSGDRPSNVDMWSNVTASPSVRNSADKVASTGRFFFGTTDTSGADTSVTSNANHGDFEQMMQEINASQLIDSSYSNKLQP